MYTQQLAKSFIYALTEEKSKHLNLTVGITSDIYVRFVFSVNYINFFLTSIQNLNIDTPLKCNATFLCINVGMYNLLHIGHGEMRNSFINVLKIKIFKMENYLLNKIVIYFYLIFKRRNENALIV